MGKVAEEIWSRIHHFHVAKGMIYTNLVITIYHCNMEMTNSLTLTESLQPLFSCAACWINNKRLWNLSCMTIAFLSSRGAFCKGISNLIVMLAIYGSHRGSFWSAHFQLESPEIKIIIIIRFQLEITGIRIVITHFDIEITEIKIVTRFQLNELKIYD